MRAKHFFANAASKALALAAAVVMMSAAFTSCSKDSDDDNGGLPEPKAQTVTIDGAEKPILKAEYADENDGNYILYLHLSAESTEVVGFQLNKKLHMTGNPITLTEKEKKHDGKWYWSISYNNPEGLQLIDTFADPNSDKPVFKTGTLTVSGSPDGTINIKLENGRVKGSDGKVYTLVLSYSGTMIKTEVG